MNTNHILTAAVVVLALSIAACSKSETPKAPSAPAPAASMQDHSQMKGDCDMSGMDMSKMSTEEHAAMMAKCQPAAATGDGHADHGDHK